MPLAAGHRIGSYEIIEPIGAGGMGEVYQARDTRLGPMVSIKLSGEQTSDRNTSCYGIHIADALAAAHAHEIVHRDLGCAPGCHSYCQPHRRRAANRAM